MNSYCQYCVLLQSKILQVEIAVSGYIMLTLQGCCAWRSKRGISCSQAVLFSCETKVTLWDNPASWVWEI